MRLSGSTRPIIFGFVLAIGITLILPYLAFGVAHSLRSSGRFRTPINRMHRQHFFSRPFQPFWIFWCEWGLWCGRSQRAASYHYSTVSANQRTWRTCQRQNLHSATLGRRRVWRGGPTARILDRRKVSVTELTCCFPPNTARPSLTFLFQTRPSLRISHLPHWAAVKSTSLNTYHSLAFPDC